MECAKARELRGLAALFLRLGATAFGGPAAHIAMMEDEVVRRREWLTHREFLDLLGATNLIPGPNSTEMAIHIGNRRAGVPGLLVAGICFIVPAMVLVTAIAWGYVRFGRLPEVQGILYGVKPVIIAVVIQALWRLGKSAVRSVFLALVCGGAAVAAALGGNELAVLFAAGFLVFLFQRAAKIPGASGKEPAGGAVRRPNRKSRLAVAPLAISGASAAVAKPFGLVPLFFFFLKTGSVLFGSGYVLLAFLRADLVERWRWLTEAQLLDAIAVGQVTPGPVFTTATFIGFVLGGYSGALVATTGIFLPAFFFVAISARLVPKLRASAAAGAFLDGVNVASLALMAVVTLQLCSAALVDWTTVALAAGSAVVLLRWKANSAWLVVGGAVCGWLASGG
jgi:chromate transporter